MYKALIPALLFFFQFPQQPVTVPVDEKPLYVSADTPKSALALPMTSDALTFKMIVAKPYPAGAIVLIDQEKMKLCSVDNLDVVVCGRGLSGTIPARHSTGTPIITQWFPEYHNRLAEEIEAIKQHQGQSVKVEAGLVSFDDEVEKTVLFDFGEHRPICVVSADGDIGAGVRVWGEQVSPTGLVIKAAPPIKATVSWMCK